MNLNFLRGNLSARVKRIKAKRERERERPSRFLKNYLATEQAVFSSSHASVSWHLDAVWETRLRCRVSTSISWDTTRVSSTKVCLTKRKKKRAREKQQDEEVTRVEKTERGAKKKK